MCWKNTILTGYGLWFIATADDLFDANENEYKKCQNRPRTRDVTTIAHFVQRVLYPAINKYFPFWNQRKLRHFELSKKTSALSHFVILNALSFGKKGRTYKNPYSHSKRPCERLWMWGFLLEEHELLFFKACLRYNFVRERSHIRSKTLQYKRRHT